MKTTLRLPDYLDLEWFLRQDGDIPPREVAERDRAIGLRAPSPEAVNLGLWLAARRQTDLGPLPSNLFRSARTVAGWGLGLVGFLAGVSLAQVLLAYSGQAPINVSVFLLAAVAPQTLLCLVSCLFLLIRRPVPGPAGSVFFLIWRGLARHAAPGDASARLEGLIRGSGRYGRMLLLEGLRLSHLAGVAFAAGALLCLLVAVVATDLAFGWQSTLRTGAAGVHDLVMILSWPWSMAPDSWNLAPGLEQIEGSRIVLKDGIAALANADLVAWWPFLSMCLLVYALFPRVGLLLVAHLGLSRLERRFIHPDQARIEDRMRAPVLGLRAPAQVGPSVPLPLRAHEQVEPPAPSSQTGEVGCAVLVPEELADRIPKPDLERLAERVCGYPETRIMTVELDADGARLAAQACAGLTWVGGFERVVLLVEAWQPPIRESLLAVADLGRDNPSGRSVFVALTGRPRGGVWLTPPSDTERRVWTEALARLAPIRITVFPVEAE